MEFNINRSVDGAVGIVEVAGEIDVYSAPRVREAVLDTISEGRYHIVVDLTAVTFLDSTGLGVLVGGLKRVRAHDGSMQLASAQDRVSKVFKITGLDRVLPIHPDLSTAIAAANDHLHSGSMPGGEGAPTATVGATR